VGLKRSTATEFEIMLFRRLRRLISIDISFWCFLFPPNDHSGCVIDGTDDMTDVANV
jgi:hypothetical protein